MPLLIALPLFSVIAFSFMIFYAKSLLSISVERGGFTNFLRRVTFSIDVVENMAKAIMNSIIDRTSKHYAAHLADLRDYFQHASDTLDAQSAAVATYAQDLNAGVKRLRDRTMPARIESAVRPVRGTAEGAAAAARGVRTELHTYENEAAAALSDVSDAAVRYADQVARQARSHADQVAHEARLAAVDDARLQTSYAIQAVEAEVSQRVGDLKRTEDAAIAAAGAHMGAALRAAVDTLGGQLTALRASVAAAEAALREELTAAFRAGDRAQADDLARAASQLAQAAATAADAEAVALAQSVAGLRAEEQQIAAAEAGALAAATGALAQTIADARRASADALAAAQAALNTRIGTVAAQAAQDLADTAATLSDAIGRVAAQAQATAAEITAAEGAVAGELPQLPTLDWDALREKYGGLDLTKLAGGLAAVPIVGALVTALASESGLTSRECRGKVKDVCATDPSKWTGLLAGLVPLGFAFSLEELLHVATGVVHEVEPLIQRLK